MISFIIIGRNEGWKLTKCFESVFEAIEYNNLKKYEIIYVDSKSSDDSIERAKRFSEIKIFQITGRCNAAIGRNVGAKESTGDILCFLDGDMEINSYFLQVAFEKGKLIHPLLAGGALDKLIDSKRKIIKKKLYHHKEVAYDKVITGGAFIIKKEVWVANLGMDNRFVRGEDPELGLRLAKNGILQKCLPTLFIIHNNDKYGANKRPKIKSLMRMNHLYGSMLIYRKTFFSRYTFIRFIKHENSLLILILSLLVGVCFQNYMYLSVYMLALFYRAKRMKTMGFFLETVVYYFLRDTSVLLGFFLFYPKKIKTEDIPYKIVKE